MDSTRDADLPALPPGFLRRRRLLDLCCTASDTDLLIVRGPAGGGKTAFLCDLEANFDDVDHLVWVTLDRHNPLTADHVWHAVDIAVDKGSAQSADRRDPATLAEILNARGGSVRVVLDDFNGSDPDLDDEVGRFATLLRRGSVVVATRSNSAMDPAALSVQARIATITADQLAFTVDEIEAVADHIAPAQPRRTALTAAEILRVGGGHPLLTRLILAADSTATTPAAIIASDWIRTTIGPERIDFAQRIALTPVVDHALARLLTGVPDSTALLDSLVADGFGMTAASGFFSFHPLVGSALKRQADATISPAERQQLYSSAADYLSAFPDHAIATFHLLALAGRTKDLWPFLARNFPTLMYDVRAVQAALADIGDDAIDADGTLGTVAAIVQGFSEANPSPMLLDRAAVAIEDLWSRPAPADAEGVLLRDVAALALGLTTHDYPAAISHAHQLEANLEKVEPANRLAMAPTIHSALLVAAATYLQSGDMYEAERVLTAIESDRRPAAALRRDIMLAYVHAMRGEVAQASAVIEDRIDRRPHSLPWSSRLTLSQAIILMEDGQLDQSVELLRELEERLAMVPEWANTLFVITRAHIAQDPEVGLEHVDQLLRVHDSRPLTREVRELLDSGVADLALAAGDIHRAVALTKNRAEQDVALRVSAGRIGLVTGDLGFIDDLRRLVRQPHVWIRRQVHAQLILAAGLHRSGSTEEASVSLRKALSLANANGVRLIQSLVPRSELEAVAAAASLKLPPNVNNADPLGNFLPPVRLTRREQALLEKLASGTLLREIADAEFVTLSTIKTQAASLYRKLGVHSRHEAINAARHRGALP